METIAWFIVLLCVGRYDLFDHGPVSIDLKIARESSSRRTHNAHNGDFHVCDRTWHREIVFRCVLMNALISLHASTPNIGPLWRKLPRLSKLVTFRLQKR